MSMCSVSFHAGLLLSAFFSMHLVSLAVSAPLNLNLEESSFVQSQVVMGSGVRRVEPLQAGEDLEDESAIDDDDDTPSLMQGGISTKQSKPKLQPVDEDAIDDEMSALQTEALMSSPESMFDEEEGIEEEEDEYSAMQTGAVMMVGERHVGTGHPYLEEEESDDAAFMQSETKVISKNDRSGAGCHADYGDDVDDEMSLIQHEALAQTGVDRSKILAWDTILAMDVNTEKDEVKQMAATLKKEASAARALTDELSDLNMELTGAEDDLGTSSPAKAQ